MPADPRRNRFVHDAGVVGAPAHHNDSLNVVHEARTRISAIDLRKIPDMTRMHTFAAVMMVGLFAAACGTDAIVAPTPPGSAVSSVAVTRGAATGQSLQLAATARMADGTSRDVTTLATWESSDLALATVSQAGAVNMIGTGEVDVRATFENTTGTLHLQVATLSVVAITVSGAPASTSSPFQLTAEARLSDGTTQDVTHTATWQSSNLQRATVTATGGVLVTGTGEVDLSATYQNTSGSVRVNVSLPSAYSVSGTITTTTGTPIAGARIQAFPVEHTLSDDRGVYNLPGVPNGRTIVEVSKSGYQVWSTIVVINGDLRLNVVLTPTTTAPTGSRGSR